jgi:uncharacterized protein (TIGR02688 family)
LALATAKPADVRTTIVRLEAEHGMRRSWIWTKLGLAPLAGAIGHLAVLVTATQKTLGGATVAEIIAAYVDWGWQADAAALDALAAVEAAEDVAALKTAVVSLYQHWLETAATALQATVFGNPTGNYAASPPLTAGSGTCILFSDALRFDAGMRLAAMLERRGLSCTVGWRLAALPTVTPTAKPALSPVAKQMSGNTERALTPVVTESYVGEFLLGRYCASTDPAEIAEGLEIVERQMRERTVRPGEEELFKSRARERGSVKLIDLITARLDTASDSYLATLPSLRLRDVRGDVETVAGNERMLTGGFYAEIQLVYDAAIAQERNGRPFGITFLRPIQLSKRGVSDDLARGRTAFTSEEWRHLLLRSVGIEPDRITRRAQDVLLLRMIPFVERNFNMIELGPRGTGKSHLYQQVSPYSHLVSGGKATVAQMFVNNASGQRGLVCLYDVVCFDEVSGISFDQKDGVNIMKGYMEAGEFSRGRENIRASGSLVMVGNFKVDVEHQPRHDHRYQRGGVCLQRQHQLRPARRHAGRSSLQAAAAQHQR